MRVPAGAVALAAAAVVATAGCRESTTTTTAVTDGAAPTASRTTPSPNPAATTRDRSADGVRALARLFVGDLRAGRYAAACRLMTPQLRVKLKAATHVGCTAALDVSRRTVGNARLARDEQAVDSLPVQVSGNSATSQNPEAPSETSHYVYVAGRWRIT